MNPHLTSQDEAKLIKPVIIKYNHTGVKCAIWAHLVGKGQKLICALWRYGR